MSAFHEERSWLREASLQRVNTMLINKKELPEHASILRDDISFKDIDTSGLSPTECFHISQWATGQESGRHCMLALLEHRRIQKQTKTVAEADTQLPESHDRSPSSRNGSLTFTLIGRSINLPGDVFAESGELHEKLFHKSPNAVLKETLKTLAEVAMEKGALSLNAEQLNLALKQLRIQTIGRDSKPARPKTAPDSVTEGQADENSENCSNGTPSSSPPASAPARKDTKAHSMESYRLQIVQELIRVYVRQASVSKSANNLDPFCVPTVPEEEGAEAAEPEAVTTKEEDLLKHHETLERHLSLSLDSVAKHSQTADMEDIERENSVLLSYIRQLTAMKGSLEVQLKDFESSRAFLSLGLSKDATTEQIRKAYHAKAVKLHPDKKGGSKEKFQQLQVQYQDIVKQRELEDSCRVKKFPEAEEHARKAQELIATMDRHLADIKAAAVTCGTVGHLNMRWVKKLETFPDMAFPKNITKMMRYILKNLESTADVSVVLESDAVQTDLSVQSCSARHLVKPMNTICDKLQKLLASGVELVSLGRYGKAASGKKSYLQLLERAVDCGLSFSDHVKDVDGVEAQVLSCVERFLDVQSTLLMSKEKLVNYTTANVLNEMALTVFRSRSITVNMIAELSVLAAVLAADIAASAHELIEKVDIELREEIRKASHDAASEMENDYSEEDLANLAKVKEQRMKEDKAEDELRCKAQEKRREEEKKKEEEAEDIIEHLSGKIKDLHVQLKLQYVQTLQKVNADACQYQQKLLKPLLNEFGATSAPELGQQGKPSAAPTTRPTYDAAEEKDRVRVLSLLADFMDRSCLRFRDALVSQREADALHEVRDEVGIPDENYRKQSYWDHLNAHLGWMAALDKSQQDTATPVKSPVPEDDADASTKNENKETESNNSDGAAPFVPTKKQLAFFVDYRSRVLYLSVLLDADTVCSIVEKELQPRLCEILLPVNAVKQPADRRMELEKNANLTASLFCALVSQGILTTKADMMQSNAV